MDNFGVGLSSLGYKHIGKTKVIIMASESHMEKAWIRSPLARQAITLHRGRTSHTQHPFCQMSARLFLPWKLYSQPRHPVPM